MILDTNVLSALMQRQPDLAVVEWLDRQWADTVWINASRSCRCENCTESILKRTIRNRTVLFGRA